MNKEDLLKYEWFISEVDKQHRLFCYGIYESKPVEEPKKIEEIKNPDKETK